MFEIEYKGGNSVVISTKKGTLLVDPNGEVVGVKNPNIKEEIQIATDNRFLVPTDGLAFEGPGEYEVGPFSITGIAAQRHIDTPEEPKRATIYRVEVGDIAIGILGNIDAKLTETQLEELNVIDILVIPVGGGGYTLDATNAAAIVRQIEPKQVIPVHYADSKLSYEVPQEDVMLFINELGAPRVELDKYKIKSSADLPAALQVVTLALK